MGDLTDDAMRRDVMSNWERERYAVETDRHACADEDSEDNTPKLGKISPDEAVILMKNMRLGATSSGEEYNSKFLARIREILRRLDMPA